MIKIYLLLLQQKFREKKLELVLHDPFPQKAVSIS